MGRRSFLLCLTLPGCGLVSGLDTLHLDDASADATFVADADAAPAVVDAATEAAPSEAGIACVTKTCPEGSICCISDTTIPDNCISPNTACNGVVSLHCDDKSDCPDAGNCCFSNGTAECVSASGTSCGLLLCNSSAECSGSAMCLPFDAGYGLSLMRCQ